jgi:hypothetical protein
VAIASEIVYLNSFSVFSLLVYRKDTEFCILILYLATFLKVFMMSRSLLVEFSGSFKSKIMSSANSDNLTYVF